MQMRCFNPRNMGGHTSPAAPEIAASGAEDEEGRESRPIPSPRSRSRSRESSAQASPTINLTREYTQALQSQSYNEIWAQIHPYGVEEGWEADGILPSSLSSSLPSAHQIAGVLHPDRDSIEEALRRAPPGNLTRLVSEYFDSSENTTRLCLLLHHSVHRARAIYAPLHDVLDLLPPTAAQTHHHSHSLHLSPAQCEWAFDTFLEFDRLDNPFPPPAGSSSQDDDGAGGGSGNFCDMRRCFAQLKQQVDCRLRRARRRARLLGVATRCSAVCLVGSAVGIVVSGLAIATHALAALVVAGGPPTFLAFLRRPGDLLGACRSNRRKRLVEHIAQLEAAGRGAYVLNNDLDTIERLVARLHASVESDKVLVRLGLERGRGDRHPIEEVVRQLRRNHPSFLHQLVDLEEHVCLCFAAINRARSLLLQQIHHHRHTTTHRQQGKWCGHSCCRVSRAEKLVDE